MMKKHILVALTLALASQAHAAGAGARADAMDPALLRALAMSEEEATFQAILAASAAEAGVTGGAHGAGAGVARGAPLGVAARTPAAVAMGRGAGDEEAALQTALRASAAHPDHALNNFNRRLVTAVAQSDFAKITHGLDAEQVHQLISVIQTSYPDASAMELHTLIHPLSSFDVEGIDANLRTELYTLLLTTPEQTAWKTILQHFAAANGLDPMKFFNVDEEGTAAAAAATAREKAAIADAIDREIEGMDPILRRVLHTLLLDTPDQSQWGNVIKGFVDTNGLAVSSFFAEANDTATKAVVDALKRIAAEEAAAEAARLEALRETLAREHAAAVASHDAGVAAVPAGAGATWAPAHVAAAPSPAEDPRARAAVIAEATRRRLQAAAATQAAIRAEAEARAVADAADAEREAEAEKAARIKAGLARLGK